MYRSWHWLEILTSKRNNWLKCYVIINHDRQVKEVNIFIHFTEAHKVFCFVSIDLSINRDSEIVIKSIEIKKKLTPINTNPRLKILLFELVWQLRTKSKFIHVIFNNRLRRGLCQHCLKNTFDVSDRKFRWNTFLWFLKCLSFIIERQWELKKDWWSNHLRR